MTIWANAPLTALWPTKDCACLAQTGVPQPASSVERAGPILEHCDTDRPTAGAFKNYGAHHCHMIILP